MSTSQSPLEEAKTALSLLDHLLHVLEVDPVPPPDRLTHGLRMAHGWLDKSVKFWEQATPSTPERPPQGWPGKDAP